MIVAIDGPAGSGKSTIAREIARKLGFQQLDTGAMYRAVTYSALERSVDLDDEEAVVDVAQAIHITFASHAGESTRIMVDGHDVSAQIRTPEVDACVSKVSAYPGVREAMVVLQRKCADAQDIVAEGRDIGTVVFPHAEVKIFLTADPHERARRRAAQRHAGEHVDEATLEREVEQTLSALEERDRLDASRAVAPLTAAPDAQHIDSTRFTIDEVVDQVAAAVNARRA